MAHAAANRILASENSTETQGDCLCFAVKLVANKNLLKDLYRIGAAGAYISRNPIGRNRRFF